MAMLLADIAPLSLAGVLVGIGALAAGIGIFRAGFALGNSFGRVELGKDEGNGKVTLDFGLGILD